MTGGEIEAALAALSPVAVDIDRDAVMYQAGYAQAGRGAASNQRGRRFWQATTGLMTAATVTLAVMLAGDRQFETPPTVVQAGESVDVVDNVDPVPAEVEPPPVPAVTKPNPLLLADPSSNYLALRAAILSRGVETWPTDYREPAVRPAESSGNSSTTVRGLLEELLPGEPADETPSEENPTEAVLHEEELTI